MSRHHPKQIGSCPLSNSPLPSSCPNLYPRWGPKSLCYWWEWGGRGVIDIIIVQSGHGRALRGQAPCLRFLDDLPRKNGTKCNQFFWSFFVRFWGRAEFSIQSGGFGVAFSGKTARNVVNFLMFTWDEWGKSVCFGGQFFLSIWTKCCHFLSGFFLRTDVLFWRICLRKRKCCPFLHLGFLWRVGGNAALFGGWTSSQEY